MKTVYVIIVNWNGWRDTVECLESVFRSDYPDYRVIVCDNGSTDGSLSCIRKWASGELEVRIPETNPLRCLSNPPVPKPVPVGEYDRIAAEAGGFPDNVESRLVLIDIGFNLGFAGGNNVGLRYVIARDDFDYVWLLNNDTVIRPDALTAMVTRMKEAPNAGICGSTIPFYHNTDILWACGGATYNKWFALARNIGFKDQVSRWEESERVERRMDYVAGASMLVSRAFLVEVGLMCEDYFLYFEELDWVARAKGRFGLVFAPESVVYHKGGGSIETFEKSKKRKHAVRDLNLGNALLFTRKFHPWALPTVWMTVLAARALFAFRKPGSGP